MLPAYSRASASNEYADTSHETDIQFVTQKSELLQAKPVAPQLPNFLSKQPVMDFITGLSASQLNTSLNARLQLFGDIDGFIDVVVNEFKVDIDIKTLSLLLSFANSVESEDKILTHMKNLKVMGTTYERLSLSISGNPQQRREVHVGVELRRRPPRHGLHPGRRLHHPPLHRLHQVIFKKLKCNPNYARAYKLHTEQR